MLVVEKSSWTEKSISRGNYRVVVFPIVGFLLILLFIQYYTLLKKSRYCMHTVGAGLDEWFI